MKETTVLPVWLVVVLTLAPALITGAAAILTAWLGGARKAAKQLDKWRRREETMRLLRWAAEKSSSRLGDEQRLGLEVLNALDLSQPAMLQPEDQGIVDAVLDAVLHDATDAVEKYGHESGNFDVRVAGDG